MSRLHIEKVLQDFDHDWLIVNELIETVMTSLEELLPTIVDNECDRVVRRRAMHGVRGVVGNWVALETIETLRELEAAFEREGADRHVAEFRELIEEISRDIHAVRATAGSV
jgi:hypothetical protein